MLAVRGDAAELALVADFAHVDERAQPDLLVRPPPRQAAAQLDLVRVRAKARVTATARVRVRVRVRVPSLTARRPGFGRDGRRRQRLLSDVESQSMRGRQTGRPAEKRCERSCTGTPSRRKLCSCCRRLCSCLRSGVPITLTARS